MTPERWQKIDKLLDQALELEADKRTAFLDEACAGDKALRRKVDALLTAHERSESFIETPAPEKSAQALAEQARSMVGRQLGHYQVLALLGVGGMGEVYSARDLKLDRKVALKILPAELASNQERMRRFVQEAKAAAALNHPNIAHIYEIGEYEGTNFIAMELVDGVTLRETMHREPTELRKLLRFLQQVAEGLSKAHAARIVHRDLKPDNIMITADGYAKILDFGLAKLVEPQKAFDSGQAGSSEIATAVMPQKSIPGMVMGTVGYMSPEQASGRVNEIDQRSDIFSFGCVLFEAATGQRPFEGKDALDSLHKIVHAPTPQLKDLNPVAPDDLQRIVRRCLAKEPEKRYQSIKDVAIELEELQQELRGRAELEYSVQPAASDGVTSASQRADEGFWVAVLPFKYPGANPDLQALAEGLTEDIVTGLSRFSYLRVIARSSTQRFTSEGADIRSVGTELGARYVMEGSIRQAATKLRVAVQLVDATTGAHLWAETYERSFDPNALFELQDALVPRIVSTVADMHGVLLHSVGNVLRDRTLDQLSPYEAVLRSFNFSERPTPEAFVDALSVLELAVRKAPNYADAWAGLACITLDDYGLGFNYQADSLTRGTAAARRAVELAPSNHMAYFMLARVHFFQREIQSFRNAAERAVALNPMDGHSIAHIGELLTYSGDWKRGLELAESARQLNPNHPGWYWFADVYHAYAEGDYRAALRFAHKVNLPGLWVEHMMIAAACGQLGEHEAAARAVQELLKLRPDFATRVRRDLERWWDSEYVEHLIDGVRKAGLEIAVPIGTGPLPRVANETPNKLEAQATEDQISRASAYPSSAEHTVNQVKLYRRGALITVAALLFAATAAYYFFFGRANNASIDSVAILPFVNVSHDPNTEYLSDGITESLINSLSHIANLRMIARVSVIRYKGREIDPQTIGRELAVRAIVTGRVEQRGDLLVISVEMVDAQNSAHLWGEQYSRKQAEILAVQDEIATEIAEKLRLRLTGEEKKQITKRYTENTEAYQLYLLGRFHWSKFTEDGVKKSIDYYNQALAKDPNYALAYFGLADSYGILATNFQRPNDVFPKVLVYVEKALALDPTLPEAHFARGAYELWYGWNWTIAEQELKAAMVPNTNVGGAHDIYGQLLAARGHFDEAIAQNKRALDFQPLVPISNSNLAAVYYLARQYDQAIAQARKTLELDPNFFPASQQIGWAYNQQGKYREAIAELTRARDLPGGFVPATSELGYAYAVSGQKAEAQKMLKDLQERAQQAFVDPYYVAIIYAGLGDSEQTFVWLNKAYDERSWWLLWLKVEPKFDRLHSDARFAELVRRVGLAP